MVTVIASWLIVSRYIDYSKQPKYLMIVLTLSLALPLSIIILLPIDLISTFSTMHSLNLSNDPLFYLNRSTIGVLWRLNYWLTFLLTWVILPFLQYWFDSGYYKPKDRFMESVKNLLMFQLLMLICCIVGFIYVICYHRDWLNFTFLKSLLITISHIYALVLALWLMAHGLIQLPRSAWTNAGHQDNRLQQCYMKIPAQKEKLDDSKYESEDLCAKIYSLKDLDVPIEYRDWVIQLLNDVPDQFRPENQRFSYSVQTEDPLTVSDINESTLHDLSIRLHRLKWAYNHNKVDLDESVKKAVRLEDEINSADSRAVIYRVSSATDNVMSPRMRYLLATYFKPWLMAILALILAILTVLIVESELTHGLQICLIKAFTSIATRDPDDSSLVTILTICSPLLAYMVISALKSLFQIKIFDIYHVESNKSSDPVSLLFFISYACRLTIPLSYNFLMLLDTDFAMASSFQEFLGGSIKLISLGNFLNELLPRLIIIPMALSLFHVWDIVKQRLQGNLVFDYFFTDFDFYDEDDDEQPDESGTRSELRVVNRTREAKNIIAEQVNRLQSDDTTSSTNNNNRELSPVSNLWGHLTSFFSRPSNISLYEDGQSRNESVDPSYDSEHSLLSDNDNMMGRID